jgi:hypothetical protein
MSQAIRDLHTQSQSQETWNTYLAARKQKPAASPVATTRPFAAPATSLRSAREAEKVGHNKCCDKKGNHV